MQKNFFSVKQEGGSITGMTVTSAGAPSLGKTIHDLEILSAASGEPSQKATGEAKVRQYLELHDGKTSKGSGSHTVQKVHKMGGEGAPIVKINYNNACDVDRLEKVRNSIDELTKIKKFSKVVKFIFDSVPNILPCQEVSIFVF